MDRDIAPEIRKRRTARAVAVSLIAVAALGFLMAATVGWLRPSIDRRDVQIARVGRGSVEATLQANGTVVPLVEQVVSSPVEARVLRVGRRAGDRVRIGDTLLTLDTAASRIDVERLDDLVAQKESEATQLRLRLDESLATLQAQIEQKKLDAEILHYSAEQKRRLREAGLLAETDSLAATAMARKSDIELRQLDEALERSRRSREAQLTGAAKDLGTVRRDRDESQRQLGLAMLRADRDGVLTWVVTEEGATVRRGDIVARVADLSSYRVVATISDIHASRIAAGMRTIVRVDDGTAIGGVIESVDPRIESGVVKFYVTLDQAAQPKLRNNLRVDVSVVAGRRTGTLVVRRGSLGRTDSNHAWLVRGENAVRTPVRFGVIGDASIEILEGAREGDQVVISDMSEYRDLRELKIK